MIFDLDSRPGQEGEGGGREGALPSWPSTRWPIWAPIFEKKKKKREGKAAPWAAYAILHHMQCARRPVKKGREEGRKISGRARRKRPTTLTRRLVDPAAARKRKGGEEKKGKDLVFQKDRTCPCACRSRADGGGRKKEGGGERCRRSRGFPTLRGAVPRFGPVGGGEKEKEKNDLAKQGRRRTARCRLPSAKPGGKGKKIAAAMLVADFLFPFPPG